MKTQINDLEKKINDLIARVNDTDGTLRENATNETLRENATNEINSIRTELQGLINEFYSLKEKMGNENSDVTITEEDIEELIDLIDSYITDWGTTDFYSESFIGGDIDDVELSINYSCEIELERATIDVQDYFCSNFRFDFDNFINYVQNIVKPNCNNERIIFLTTQELFKLISEIIYQSVTNIDTSISFSRFEDFDCEMDSYKKIEVTDVRIDGDEFCEQFKNEFDFDRDDIENIIKNYYNFKSDENSEEENSEENNSEE
jgi:hypothetical protein